MYGSATLATSGGTLHKLHACIETSIHMGNPSSDQNLYRQINNESSFDRTLFMGRQPTAQVCDEIYADRSLRLGETKLLSQGRGIRAWGKNDCGRSISEVAKIAFC